MQISSSLNCHVIIIRLYFPFSFTQFTRNNNYLDRNQYCILDCNLDRNPEDVPIYTGHSLSSTTKGIKLLFIVQSLLHCNPSNIWIEIIQITIQIECLHRKKFLDPDSHLDRILDNFVTCKVFCTDPNFMKIH